MTAFDSATASVETPMNGISAITLETAAGTLLPVFIGSNYADICGEVARQIARVARERRNAVLGLATGSTPIGVYDALIRLAASGAADLSAARSFNLDEYYPMEADSPQSYHTFMRRHLFDQVPWGHWHVPSGRNRPREIIEADCRAYEAAIQTAGGIDLQLLGIGRTGHIGFNEPGSARDSRTRLVDLSAATREDAAQNFGGLEQTPHQAVSMGLGTILEARRILLMASGASKAGIVRRAFLEPPTTDLPASLLQQHPGTALYLDTAAASDLF